MEPQSEQPPVQPQTQNPQDNAPQGNPNDDYHARRYNNFNQRQYNRRRNAQHAPNPEQILEKLVKKMTQIFKPDSLNGYLVHKLQRDMSISLKDVFNENRLRKVTRNSELLLEALRKCETILFDEQLEKIFLDADPTISVLCVKFWGARNVLPLLNLLEGFPEKDQLGPGFSQGAHYRIPGKGRDQVRVITALFFFLNKLQVEGQGLEMYIVTEYMQDIILEKYYENKKQRTVQQFQENFNLHMNQNQQMVMENMFGQKWTNSEFHQGAQGGQEETPQFFDNGFNNQHQNNATQEYQSDQDFYPQNGNQGYFHDNNRGYRGGYRHNQQQRPYKKQRQQYNQKNQRGYGRYRNRNSRSRYERSDRKEQKRPGRGQGQPQKNSFAMNGVEFPSLGNQNRQVPGAELKEKIEETWGEVKIKGGVKEVVKVSGGQKVNDQQEESAEQKKKNKETQPKP